MLKIDSQSWVVVWYEGEGSAPVDGGVRFEAFRKLLDLGYSVIRVAAGQKRGAPAAAAEARRMLVLGAFPEGAPRVEDVDGRVELSVRDVSALDAEGIVGFVESWRGDGAMNQPPLAGSTTWKPWFPVIDYSRCTNCMQCLSFCLFDVYGIDEKQKIQVQNQDNCKTNCPACSRVCPEVAIMFPKYSGSPINGAPVSEQDLSREKMKVDISALLGGDIYASLRSRSEAAKSRFSKERSPDKALEERKKCLVKLQSDGFIPAEVFAGIDLASLPSPDEIMRKAREKAALAAEHRGEL